MHHNTSNSGIPHHVNFSSAHSSSQNRQTEMPLQISQSGVVRHNCKAFPLGSRSIPSFIPLWTMSVTSCAGPDLAGARTHDRRVPADLSADSQATVHHASGTEVHVNHELTTQEFKD
ncbi:hypothetical protein PoB_005853600 [Plakobranchus ocellatus]|uniref:Uncharacterized protein n=1 Tax=Plakobranchus ocellatus TaxID=259542 RepID=A0AAV4CGV0_9GAST|nr:hypothetical protein PoB_005853600 [Plakobranchus ocellatus]